MTSFTVLRDAGHRRGGDRRSLRHRGADGHRSSAASFAWRSPAGARPSTVYPLLLEPARRDAVEWEAVEFFWGDERAVPPDHPESNFGVAYGMLISQLPDVRPDRIHRMPAEAPDLDAAALTLRERAAARVRRARRRAAGLRPHLARHGSRRAHRQPVSRLGRARGATSLGDRQLRTGPGRLADDAHLPGPERRPRGALRRRPARTRPMRCARSGPEDRTFPRRASTASRWSGSSTPRRRAADRCRRSSG